ncbi:MAG: GTPase ObgE, partial [Thermodesulfobacteriota bacterium]
GGDGGRGGDIRFISDGRMTSLLDFRYKRHYEGGRGGHGMGSDRHGKDGEDAVMHVPPGTLITDSGTGERLADLTRDGEEFLCLKGGRGGKGNAHFKSSTRQAPRFAQPGEEGEEMELQLELKLLADVGIIGFPNAGKSTLISRISAAKPKVADYPFTTLVPHLGVVRRDDKDFIVADIPGLVEGAHTGKGLGIRFLKHIERTSLFIHILDLSPDTDRDPMEDFKVIMRELEAFSPELAGRPSVLVLNKVDLTEAREALPGLLKFFTGKGIKVFPVSAVTGDGLTELVDWVGTEVERLKSEGKNGGKKERDS